MSAHKPGSAASATASSTSSDSADLLTPEARAAALWTFLQAKAPRFTYEEALELVRELDIHPDEDQRALAKRLCTTLERCRIKLKYTNALHAVSRLFGHSSWHTNTEASKPRLRLTMFENILRFKQVEFAAWTDVSVALREWVDQLHARGDMPLGVLKMDFIGRTLNLSALQTREQTRGRVSSVEHRIACVTPVSESDDGWLADAPGAMERLRRSLEESGRAVFDGYAVLYQCARAIAIPGDREPVTAADVANSELVLLREDNEDDPHGGYEIARGDELTCWHQMELSLRDDGTDKMPDSLEISVPVEGGGAWRVNGIRYVWVLETLKPNEYVPGRVFDQLSIDDCNRLLRRYRLARRIHDGGFRHHDVNKRVEYLSGPAQTWRVDLHRLLHLLKKANLTWEDYIWKFKADPTPMKANLPVGFVMRMLEDLGATEPNSIFAWPNLAEMARVTNDRLLCSLTPRVDHVRYVKPRGLDEQVLSQLHEAVTEFSGNLQVQKMLADGALKQEVELPYLVYASAASELVQAAESLGMTMYVAVMPHLVPTNGLLTSPAGVKMWPWALAHSLAVRFEVRSGQQAAETDGARASTDAAHKARGAEQSGSAQ